MLKKKKKHEKSLLKGGPDFLFLVLYKLVKNISNKDR